jgi:cell division septum initiation protein DivIVA
VTGDTRPLQLFIGEDLLDITATLDALAEAIAAAKPRALGGGAIIDRDRAMQLVEQARTTMPEEIRQAQGVLAERDIVIANAHTEADQIRAEGRLHAEQLVADDEVTRSAHAEAERILSEAHAEAERKRAEVDAYVDAKLASFEQTLQRTLESVAHGRAKLAGYVEEYAEQPVA